MSTSDFLNGAMKVYRGRRIVPKGIIEQPKLSHDYYLVIHAEKLKRFVCNLIS